ncbi:MAG: Nif11-like leader peptide family RiPP precursor [Xenococcaceae cyanobacterium]
MSIEAVNQFLQKVSEDTSLQSELAKALNSENARQEATNLSAKYGYMFTQDELWTEIHSRQNELQQMLSDGELNEQELEAVAGGGVTEALAGNATALATTAGKITNKIAGVLAFASRTKPPKK